jgi:hypothetical protein
MKGAGLIVLGLALAIAPRLATAAVVVAEPTGDADAAFLAELKASLETVAAEAPSEANGELRSSAVLTEAGVDLVVEYVPFMGAEPVRETRTASKASALPQAREMARMAMKAIKNSLSVAEAPTAQASLVAATASRPEVMTTPPEAFGPLPSPLPLSRPLPPPLPEKYSRHKAMLLSLVPTGAVAGAGAAMAGMSVRARGMLIPAVAIASLGLVLGPSVGYFWIGETPHALGLSGLRLCTAGVGVAFMALFVSNFRMGDDCTTENGHQECEVEEEFHPGYLAGAIVGITATIAAAFVDAGLVGRAADRVNAEWRESRIVRIQATPIVWSSANGDETFGLAVSGTF